MTAYPEPAQPMSDGEERVATGGRKSVLTKLYSVLPSIHWQCLNRSTRQVGANEWRSILLRVTH